MTHWKKLHNPDYIGAYSLDKDGTYQDLIVEIVKVSNQVVKGPDGKSDECIVAELKNQKPMILNATNCKTLSKLFDSPQIENWYGKSVTLYVAKVKAFGEVTDALRIRTEKPAKPELVLNSDNFRNCKAAIDSKSHTIDQVKNKYNVSAEVEAALLK